MIPFSQELLSGISHYVNSAKMHLVLPSYSTNCTPSNTFISFKKVISTVRILKNKIFL